MMRSLNVYIAWVFVLIVVGAIVLPLPLTLLAMPLIRMNRAFADSGAFGVFEYAAIGAVALVFPAWRWRKRGLLPTGVSAERGKRVERGERLLRIGHVMLFAFVSIPFAVSIVKQELMYLWLLPYSIASIPLCLVLWIIGLYLINMPGRPAAIR